MSRTEWKCTEPVRDGNKIRYKIYRLKTIIRCKTNCDMKTVKQQIKKTLDRLNYKSSQGYT
jgi:hypothetical protein